MWNLSVVLCVLLFGSSANSMDVDEKNSNDGLDKINYDRISTEANEIIEEAEKEITEKTVKEITKEITEDIEKELLTFIEKAKLIHKNLDEIATNVRDAGVDDWSIDVVNIIDTNGKQLVSNVKECIAKDVTSLRKLFDYCKSLTIHSGVKNKDFVDDSFYEEAGNTETDVKRKIIKKDIYLDAIMMYGTVHTKAKDMIDKMKQLLKYCQAEERGNFYAATIRDIISREHYIQKKIEVLHDLPVPQSMDIDEENSRIAPENQWIADYISIEAENIYAKQANPIFTSLLKVNPDYTDLLGTIRDVDIKDVLDLHVTGTTLVLRTRACIMEDMASIIEPLKKQNNFYDSSEMTDDEAPYVAPPYNKEAEYEGTENEKIKLEEAIIRDLSVAKDKNFSLEDVLNKIRTFFAYCQIDERIASYADVKKPIGEARDLPSQIESWLKADPSAVVEDCKGDAKCMVRRLMRKIFGEKLLHMSPVSCRNYAKFPLLVLDLVEQYVNENAKDKLSHEGYLKCVRSLCQSVRSNSKKSEKRRKNEAERELSDAAHISTIDSMTDKIGKEGKVVRDSLEVKSQIESWLKADPSVVVTGCKGNAKCMVRRLMRKIFGEKLLHMSPVSCRNYAKFPALELDLVEHYVNENAKVKLCHEDYLECVRSLCQSVRSNSKNSEKRRKNEAERELSDATHISTIDSMTDKIRKEGKVTVVRDSLQVKSQIESWLKADPSAVVEDCKGDAKCMVRRLMRKIFGEKLLHMSPVSCRNYAKFPALELDLVEHYVNENAKVKLCHEDYLECVRSLCKDVRSNSKKSEKRRINKAERELSDAAHISTIDSMTDKIGKEGKVVRDSLEVKPELKELTAGSSGSTSSLEPSQTVPNANPNEIIKTLSEYEIKRIGTQKNFEPLSMVREIMIRMLNKEELFSMSASSSHKFATIPSKVLDYVKEIVDKYAERKLSDGVYMLTIDSLCDKIRNEGKCIVVRDSLEVKSQIESWLKADPSVVVENCKGDAKCMVRRPMKKKFAEKLPHMSLSLHGKYAKIPLLVLDLVEHYVNENAAVKLSYEDYLKYVHVLCNDLRNNLKRKREVKE